MKYGSVCSGIEAATVAWHPLGWEAAWHSEIEPFPCAVLKHHYPSVPNWGDMTKFQEWPDEPIDLLVGGTPCQSFSVAGLRKGLDDPRGNLMLTFGAIARRFRPEWLLWENVPGVLSSNGGRDFGTFLGMLAELGYGFAYRVLDAQYFGVPQRRRRVFVCAVRGTGNWQRAAAVLFESHSLQGHPAPRREARQGVAEVLGRSVAGCLNSAGGHAVPGNSIQDADQGYLIPTSVAQSVAGSHWDHPSNPHPTLNQSAKGSGGIAASDQELFSQRGSGLVPQPMTTFAKTHKPMSATDAEGWSPVDAAPTVTHWPRDRSDAGTDVAVVQPLNFYGGNRRADRPEGGFYVKAEETSKTLDAASGLNPTCSQGGTAVMQPVAFRDPCPTLTAKMQGSSGWAPANEDAHLVGQAMQVRRLTPVECERLQGFPDGYTNIPWRGKRESPDGPRYKALGNSMAVPVMAWIGKRIKQVSEL